MNHQHELLKEIYIINDRHYGRKGTVVGHVCSPGYTSDYVILVGKTKRYLKKEEISGHMPMSSRKQLYGEIGTHATKIIRRLRDQGLIEINLPANNNSHY